MANYQRIPPHDTSFRPFEAPEGADAATPVGASVLAEPAPPADQEGDAGTGSESAPGELTTKKAPAERAPSGPDEDPVEEIVRERAKTTLKEVSNSIQLVWRLLASNTDALGETMEKPPSRRKATVVEDVTSKVGLSPSMEGGVARLEHDHSAAVIVRRAPDGTISATKAGEAALVALAGAVELTRLGAVLTVAERSSPDVDLRPSDITRMAAVDEAAGPVLGRWVPRVGHQVEQDHHDVLRVASIEASGLPGRPWRVGRAGAALITGPHPAAVRLHQVTPAAFVVKGNPTTKSWADGWSDGPVGDADDRGEVTVTVTVEEKVLIHVRPGARVTFLPRTGAT